MKGGANTHDEEEEIEVQITVGSKQEKKVPSVYVPGQETEPEIVVSSAQAGKADSVTTPQKTQEQEATHPAKLAQTDAGSDEDKKNEEKTEDEKKSGGIGAILGKVASSMKTLTAKINKLNRDQKSLQKTFGQLKKAFGALSKNGKGVLNMFGGAK